jgi:cytochrome c oxidase subunit 2
MMKRALAVLMLLILAFAVACGGDDDDDGSTEATNTTGAGSQTTVTTGGTTPTTGGADLEGDPAAGQQQAQTSGCVACHTTDGTALVGPTWQGLYGREVTLESGETVTADDAYIKESILTPNAKVVEGFAPTMPPFQGQLDDQQIADIIAYIKTLE